MSEKEEALSIRPIRTEQQHRDALQRASELMTHDDQKSIDELMVLQAVVDQWERSRFAMEVTPADAIKFRMEQAGITRRELVPLLGTKSRVSEILSGQRQLTVDQIRALHRHFGIPPAALVGSSKHETPNRRNIASDAAIAKLRGLKVMKPREGIDAFIARAMTMAPAVAMLRKTRTGRTNAKTDLTALEAWCSAVLVKAENEKLPEGASNTRRDKSLARQLAKLSVHEDGPLRAAQFLRSVGVILVTMDHLPGTFLDGAAICRRDGSPVIALTLRHDRIDNFWFTLLHEFAHVCLHLSEAVQLIVDDLEVKSSDEIEHEADAFAREALIPAKNWKSLMSAEVSASQIEKVATDAEVHLAIVAGRWRWEHSDYRRFSKLLGHGQVRNMLQP
jgi:HTH-type transcriptional regulator/antitoxin HigA